MVEFTEVILFLTSFNEAIFFIYDLRFAILDLLKTLIKN